MKLLELYNQILESKRTEMGAVNILQRYHKEYLADYEQMAGGMHKTTKWKILEDPNTIIDQLKSIDTSEGQINLESMAYLLCQQLSPRDDVGDISMDHMRSTFEDYNDLLGRQKIKPLQLSKKTGLLMGDIPMRGFLEFQEYIHGTKNLYGGKDKRSGELVVDIDDKPVFNKNGIEIYDAFDVGRCIKYGFTSQIDKGMKPYSFCISDPKMTNNMWQSYRDSKGSTFYFIFDKNRDAEDPLHMVVFDNTNRRGVELTDANNHTGSVAEYGTDSEGYINYLESKGVSARDLMPNREYSDSEKEESGLLSRKNGDLKWFVDLPLEYKEKYIGRGHKLEVDQFMYISPNGDLVAKYIQLGHILDNKTQFDVLSSNQRKTYLRSRMNMITHFFSEEDEYDRKRGLDDNRFWPYELPHIPESIRTEYIMKLASFIPLEEYEFEFVPEDKIMEVKKSSYIRDANKDKIMNMSKDADYPMDERLNVIEIYLDTRFSRGPSMIEGEIFNHLPKEEQDIIMKRLLDNGFVFNDDWETTIPKRFLKVYVELIGKNGNGHLTTGLLSQPLTDLYIKTMGDNDNRLDIYDLKTGSQDARDYYLMKGLEQGHPTAEGIRVNTDMLVLGSDRVKAFYWKRYDRTIGNDIEKNVRDNKSPYKDITSKKIKFTSPHHREAWYMERLEKYSGTLRNLGAAGGDDEDKKDLFGSSVPKIIEGLVEWGEAVMNDTSDEFRRDAFGKFIEMANGSLGEFVKLHYNMVSFRNFVEKYCPKDMVRTFVEMVPEDEKFNVWDKSTYLEDNNV